MYAQMSKALIVSPEFSCSQEILIIVAMLSGGFVSLLLMTLIIFRCSSQYLVTTKGPAERSRYREEIADRT
jgi:hypothetical protein